MTFAQAVIKKSATPIHYLRGSNGLGNECHWFICCTASKYEQLLTDVANGGVDLADYGAIVAKGLGPTPDEATKQMLIRDYKVKWSDYEDAMK